MTSITEDLREVEGLNSDIEEKERELAQAKYQLKQTLGKLAIRIKAGEFTKDPITDFVICTHLELGGEKDKKYRDLAKKVNSCIGQFILTARLFRTQHVFGGPGHVDSGDYITHLDVNLVVISKEGLFFDIANRDLRIRTHNWVNNIRIIKSKESGFILPNPNNEDQSSWDDEAIGVLANLPPMKVCIGDEEVIQWLRDNNWPVLTFSVAMFAEMSLSLGRKLRGLPELEAYYGRNKTRDLGHLHDLDISYRTISNKPEERDALCAKIQEFLQKHEDYEVVRDLCRDYDVLVNDQEVKT
jgi:hypothetical protein